MKMRGKRKKWGRCKLHGQHCEVACNIRENISTRASEKEEIIKEIKNSFSNELPLDKDINNVY